jgi:tryptophan-rich sensory protein
LRIILFVVLEFSCWITWYRAPGLGRTSDFFPLYVSIAAMLLWCIVFFRNERFLAKAGLLSVLAILLLGILLVSN